MHLLTALSLHASSLHFNHISNTDPATTNQLVIYLLLHLMFSKIIGYREYQKRQYNSCLLKPFDTSSMTAKFGIRFNWYPHHIKP